LLHRTLLVLAPVAFLFVVAPACSSSGGADMLVTGDSVGGTRCSDGGECQSGICMNGVCVGTQSTRPQSACTGNLDCDSQLCLRGLCANSDTPGEQCQADAECPAGTCASGNCVGNGTAPLFHNCLTDADCMTGYCHRRQCDNPDGGASTDMAVADVPAEMTPPTP
jgi:hypothetical protein